MGGPYPHRMRRGSAVVRRFLLLVLPVLVLPAGPVAGAAPAAAGGRDAPVAPAAVPQRIVSLAPSITECLFAIGAGDEVVGVTRWCRRPPAARSRTIVGGILDPDYERILALQPDLIVVETAHAEARDKLAALGLTVLAVEHRTLEGMLASLTRLGEVCGTAARADSLRRALERRIAAVAADSGGVRPPVLVVVGVEDATGRITSVFAASAGTFLGELVELAGGRNVLPGQAVRYPTLGVEGLLAAGPAVVLDLAPDCADDPGRLARRRRAWAELTDLPAVRDGHVVVVTDPDAAVPGPHVVDILELFAHAIGAARH